MDDEQLDRAFTALGDPVRRALVARLSRGEATVNELAEPFPITKQAVSRHIQVLEAAGLITRSRDAQRRPCRLDPAALEALTGWIDTITPQNNTGLRHITTKRPIPQPRQQRLAPGSCVRS